MRKKSIWLIILLILSSCSGNIAVKKNPLINPCSNPKYPCSLYITGVGESCESIKLAEEQAKTSVAEQVKSSLKAESSSLMRECTSDGEGVLIKDYIQKILIQTSFRHAEMIKIDPGSCMKCKGSYHAFAYLSKDELGDVLAKEYDSKAFIFRKQLDLLENTGTSLPAFTTGYSQIKDLFENLVEICFEFRAATGQAYREWDGDLTRFRKTEAKRLEILRSSRIKLHIDENQDQYTSSLKEVLLQTLSECLLHLGFEATPGDCEDETYIFFVTPTLDWRQGPFGPQCLLKLKGKIVECSIQKTLAEFDLNSGEFTGTGMREKSGALKNLIQRITTETFTPLLRQALSTVFPI